MNQFKDIELPVSGMDCAECTAHVKSAIEKVPGILSVDVLLSSEKAYVRYDPSLSSISDIHRAVESSGYKITGEDKKASPAGNISKRVSILLGFVFATVLALVVAGEILGLFDKLNEIVPYPIGLAVVIAGGFTVFLKVIKAALKRQITSHMLMTVGVIAALIAGQWVTAAVVVLFMRIGDYVESFTTESARNAVRGLTASAPMTGRVVRDEIEMELPVSEITVGDIVVVRPGEKIPVDGEVISGHATIDQSAITGESMPLEAAQGSRVYAATIAKLGSIRVKTVKAGNDTTFGKVIKMVTEAEAHRADVQRFADKFSGYYLPVVIGIAALTFLISRNALSTAAVLVVACSCSFALATPIALLASIGSSAKRGLLIKGGKYLESLSRADVLLVDKTGTLTLGEPEITDYITFNGMEESEILTITASAERYSEHPLAQAVRKLAASRNLSLLEPEDFEAIPGEGIKAKVNGRTVTVGSRNLISGNESPAVVSELEKQGKTLLLVFIDGKLSAVLAASDTLRPEVPEALNKVRKLGVEHIELLTGDNETIAASLAGKLGIKYRANLLPENKINIVKEYQGVGKTVVMVGDGVNDAPALAQADIGISMGKAGTDIAVEASHIALMRDDWLLIPDVLRIAKRTMKVIKMNIIFTAVYNFAGLSLAAFGILPPVLAAAAQSLPDLGILANSARLLRHKEWR